MTVSLLISNKIFKRASFLMLIIQMAIISGSSQQNANPQSWQNKQVAASASSHGQKSSNSLTELPKTSSTDDSAQALKTYNKLPMRFEANHGQTDGQVKFLARGGGYTLFLTASEAVLALSKTSKKKRDKANPEIKESLAAADQSRQEMVRMKLIDSNKESEIKGIEELSGASNYFIGSNPKQWQTNVVSYGKVKYEQIYPNIDLIYYGNQQRLEYDFVVAPGADPSVIKIGFEGAKSIRTDTNGNLLLKTRLGELLYGKPVVYQQNGEAKQNVAGQYVINQNKQIQFKIGDYDKSLPLIIDPVLSYSTYLGGANRDYASGVAVDSAGNVYVAGHTESANFPIVNGLQTTFSGAFVTKINAAGTGIIYSTFLGGSQGDQEATGITIDPAGNAYVAGWTNAPDFPTVNAVRSGYGGGNDDAFVTKINAGGTSLLYSTYLGGSNADGAKAIAIDSAGNAYVAGGTWSPNFPVVNAVQPTLNGIDEIEGFVTKISAAGTSIIYSTYLGGSQPDRNARKGDLIYGIAVDPAGNAYVTGITYSPNFPMVNSLQSTFGGGNYSDAFLTKISAAGTSLVYSTFLGGSGDDHGVGIAVDSVGNAYITGGTLSANFPLVNAIQNSAILTWDSFVTKVNASGTSFVYSTKLGGDGYDGGSRIAVDSAGNVYVAGHTESANFPIVNGVQTTFSGNFDVFVTKISAAGTSIGFSTFLGGSEDDYASGIAVDSCGNIYVVGEAGSPNFPIAGALQTTLNGYSDAFIAKIDLESPGKIIEVAPDATGLGPNPVISAEYKFPAVIDPDVTADRKTE